MTTFPGHAAGAFIAIEIVSFIDPSLGLDKIGPLVFGTLAGVFPDADMIFYLNSVKDHHDTPTHTPLFWVLVFAIVLIFSRSAYVTAAFIGITTHLFLDWYGGRICGIRIFYPLSKKRYSLFPLERKKFKKVDFSKEYRNFYAANKILLFSEVLLVLGAAVILILKLIQ